MPDDNKYVLAIDLGTSGPKVALVSMRGEVAGWEFEKNSLLLLPGGGAEQDPREWWQAICQACRRLLDRHLIPVESIVAICCTGQWSGTVAVDRDGSPLMNAIIWMDSRGAPYVREITGGLLKIDDYGIRKLFEWIALTGGVPTHSGKDPIAHILYIQHQLPGIYQATYKFLEPKDYINLRLTGRFTASFDSIALHWLTDNRNLAKVTYNDALVRYSTIAREKLPDLKGAVDILGPLRPEAAADLGLPENVQVVVGTPDVHSAAIGSGGVRDFEAHLYIGTSAWLSCHVPFKKSDLFHNLASLPSGLPGRYLILDDQETAGACLNFLRDNLLYSSDEFATEADRANVYQEFDRIVETAEPGSGRLIFTPWLYGERAPVDDHSIRGAFSNLSLQTTRAQVIRSVYEGVAFNARWLLGYIETFAGRRLDPIKMVGGGARSNIWCQIHADVLNRTIQQVSEPTLVNLRGAALLASFALGCIRVEDIPNAIEIQQTYAPDSAHRKIYDELFREFVNLYRSNHKMYARLNKSALGPEG